MNEVSRDTNPLHDILMSELARAWEAGNPVAGSTDATRQRIASVVRRRWQSLYRRKVSASDSSAVTRDLVHGLIETFEADPRLVGPLKLDYEHLATQLLAAIWNQSDDRSANHPNAS